VLIREQPAIWDVLDIGDLVGKPMTFVVPFKPVPQSIILWFRNPPQVLHQLEVSICKSEGNLRSLQTHCELPLGAAAAVGATDEARQCAAARRQGELRGSFRSIQPGEKGHLQQLVVVGDAGEKIFFAACEGLQQRMKTLGFKHVACRERPACFQGVDAVVGALMSHEGAPSSWHENLQLSEYPGCVCQNGPAFLRHACFEHYWAQCIYELDEKIAHPMWCYGVPC